jgi:hypothetical protein
LEGEGDLVIENVSDEDEGKYQCLAKNIVATRATEKAELQVQGTLKAGVSITRAAKSVCVAQVT